MDSGWREAWGRWELKYQGKLLAAVYVAEDGTARMILQGPKLWQVKHVTAGGLVPAKKFAERWCAARQLPELPLKDAVQRIRGDEACGCRSAPIAEPGFTVSVALQSSGRHGAISPRGGRPAPTTR